MFKFRCILLKTFFLFSPTIPNISEGQNANKVKKNLKKKNAVLLFFFLQWKMHKVEKSSHTLWRKPCFIYIQVKIYLIWKENSTVDIKWSESESISLCTHWHGGHCLSAISKDPGTEIQTNINKGEPLYCLPKDVTLFLLSSYKKIFCISMTGVNSDYLKGQAKQ